MVIKNELFPKAVFLIVALLSLVGCSDSDYSLKDADKTIGINVNLALPTSSSDKIVLGDFFKIKEEGCVRVLENGDYVLQVEGGGIQPRYVTIDSDGIPALLTKSRGADVSFTQTIGFEGLPNFLSEDNVCADFDNPLIYLELDTDLPVALTFTGALTSIKQGRTLSEIEVPNIHTVSAGPTKVLICRHTPAVKEEGITQIIEIEKLSDLIRTIPDNISFLISASIPSLSIGSFVPGKRYFLQPSCRIIAPLAFAKDAKIVYNDTLNNWNKDLQDIKLYKMAKITLTSTMENCIPAYLKLSVQPIDTKGDIMSEEDFIIEQPKVVAASSEGKKPAEQSIAFAIVDKSGKSFNSLDGLIISIEASASAAGYRPVVGVTLNKSKHYIRFDNIEASLNGVITVNEDD